MIKSLFERYGGTYHQVGDYLLPNITIPEEETSLLVYGATASTLFEATLKNTLHQPADKRKTG